MDGLTYWLFGTPPPASDSLIALTDFSTATFAAVAVVVALTASALLVRRHIRVEA